ncbi:glycoside hydrolase family 16 protein [Microbispora hainanensis]|uniref:Glycoside hydrolase family 16 protein n=1 Tax=Microbispora hainanensis TaxID=568844 RepID=A0A544Z1P9_9ACTN|nr:glycoside hydrolase family 16 protein [Microbispora hainanensis]TQS22994.1 glycoside hydrolase family 16 protein [Microbispora hainanensis]
MAAAMLIAAATACSNADSVKVFTAGDESAAQGSASSPDSSGARPGNANAAGLSATQTATAAAAPAGEDAGQEAEKAADTTGDTTIAEKIGDIPAASRPSPSLSPLPSPGLSPGPRATAGTETEPPMRLAEPVRPADGPVVVNAVEPEDVPRAAAQATPGAARASSPPPSKAPSKAPSAPASTPSRTPAPHSSGAAATGWGAPALAEDFGGQALRITGNGGADLSGTSLQRYGRWEVRLRADAGALPAVLLQSPRSGTAEYGNARRGGSRFGRSPSEESRYDEPAYDSPYDMQYGSQYDDSYGSQSGEQYGEQYGGSWRGGPRDDVPGSARFPGTDDTGTDGTGTDGTGSEDAAIGVAATAGGRAELSVRQGRELARAELAAGFTQGHTVTVDWLPGRVTFWLDGRQVWNYTGPYVPRSPLGLVLRNDASGGTVYVEWVRVYRAPQ